MWRIRPTQLLMEELEAVLAPLANTADLYGLVKEPLNQALNGLTRDSVGNRPWPLLPLVVYEAISADFEKALPIAAALQFLHAAAEVFDDIEDADSSGSLATKNGPAIAINAATTLLILAEKAITRLKERGVEDSLIVRVTDTINSCYATAAIGQHLDLSITPEKAASEDIYLKIADMKSAITVECACHTGAMLATANQELIDKFAEFGHNLGMAAQIANDIQGVTRESDILKHKITLPVIYALSQTEGEAHQQLELTFCQKSTSTPDTNQIKNLLFSTGSVHYATVKMEFYKQLALDILSEIEEAGIGVERLKPFLG